FDLSAGSLASWAGVLIISFFTWHQVGMWLSIPLTILAAIITNL
ncbi:MAG TPA: sugar ABC transporter permease, partial [Firmicutes bacterium]|nr:sugar ABC transporter permease [Bacillota bacterium]